MYKYQFTSTIEDLLEAEEAERTARSVRAPFRWVIILFGFLWLVAGGIAFDWSNLTWRPVIWLLIGLGIIYYFSIKPYLKRKRIKSNNAQRQDLALEFDEDGINLDIEGLGACKRGWEELIEYIDTGKGIIFYFSDGVVNWLPERVFGDKNERSEFVGFLELKGSKPL